MAALKKKGSAISIFSGLSISTMLSDPLDPTLDKCSEDPRRHDTGGSVKGREASQLGLPEDELDGKWSTAGSDSASSAASKHISLGKCTWQFELQWNLRKRTPPITETSTMRTRVHSPKLYSIILQLL